MAEPTKTDYFFKLLPFLLTLLTVIVGLYQFNKGQKENADSRDYQFNMQILSKFKETQQKVYSETMSLVGYLSNNTDEINSDKYKENYNRLEQMYWVDLAPVESPGVDTTLIHFKNDLDNLWYNKDNYWSGSSKLTFNDVRVRKVYALKDRANAVADAIKNSSMDWSLPGGLKGLGGQLNKNDK